MLLTATRRAALSLALSSLALTSRRPALAADDKAAFERASRAAYAKFQAADYPAAEQAWAGVAENFPKEPLAFANWATVLIILASDGMSLGVKPTGEPLARLERALDCLEKAEALGSRDALLLNDRGNALGLLQRWEEARAAYGASADASPRDFEAIPRSNEALVSFELGEEARAEREVRTLLRRDPAFKDGEALLAALQWSQGSKEYSQTVAQLCNEPGWCARYSTVDVVMGRWTPRAVEAWRGLLQEKAVQRELKDGFARAR